MNIMDLAEAVAPGITIELVGIRPGEKLHEVMISTDDAINTLEYDDRYVIQPSQPWWDDVEYRELTGGTRVPDDFKYASDCNTQWLTIKQLRKMIQIQ